jgi:membrane protein YqaA with SNARE-associated domain
MDKKSEGTLQIVFAILVIVVVIYFSKEISSFGAYGYLGAFFISILSSATIFFPAPGWAAIIALSSTLDPVILGIFAGVGSAIGELTGYIAGDGIRDIMNSKIKETKNIEKLVRKYDVFAIMFLAFVPNPFFDVAGIISGGLKIPWWRYLIAAMIGRVCRYVLLALIGGFTLELLT